MSVNIEEAIAPNPFRPTSADKAICVAAAVYAVIALAWRRVPLEIFTFFAVYFSLSRIRLRWLKPPSEAVYIAVIVGAIAYGGLRRGEIIMMAMQFLVFRIMMDMPRKRPKKPSLILQVGSTLLLVLTVVLAVCALGLAVFAVVGML